MHVLLLDTSPVGIQRNAVFYFGVDAVVPLFNVVFLRLQTYFEDNPRDLQVLRHNKALATTKMPQTLKNVPDYAGRIGWLFLFLLCSPGNICLVIYYVDYYKFMQVVFVWKDFLVIIMLAVQLKGDVMCYNLCLHIHTSF